MKAWEQFLESIEKLVGSEAIEQWLKSLKIIRFDAGNLYLEAKDSFQIAWFEEHIRPLLLKRFLNNNFRPIRVHLSLKGPKSQLQEKQQQPTFSIKPDTVDSEMKFQQFISSPKNEIAFKLLQQKTPLFNPIYLYGPCGSGKTHLAMSLASELAGQGKKSFYVKAETFTSHVVQAIRLGHMQEFRQVYRQIDALIIDDIEVFARKDATQEEFFHTFNTLHTSGKTIVLTSKIPPSQLSEIEPRLISRFEWGVSIGINNIDPRLILEKKASILGISLTQELIEFFCSTFPSNPILAFQLLVIRAKRISTLNLEEAKSFLVDLIEKEKTGAITPETIIKIIASHFGIRQEDLLGKSQMKEFTHPRQIAMYLCRERLQLPYQKIGQIFSRDHSTVMTSIKQIDKWIQENKSEWTQIENLSHYS